MNKHARIELQCNGELNDERPVSRTAALFDFSDGYVLHTAYHFSNMTTITNANSLPYLR